MVQRTTQERPLGIQLSQTESFVERAKKRLAAHDEKRVQLVRELEESEVATPVPPPDWASEIAQLKAKLLLVEKKRDAVAFRAKSVSANGHPVASGRMIPPMPVSRVPAELDDWMFDRHADLKDAMEFGENVKVLELTSMLVQAAEHIPVPMVITVEHASSPVGQALVFAPLVVQSPSFLLTAPNCCQSDVPQSIWDSSGGSLGAC